MNSRNVRGVTRLLAVVAATAAMGANAYTPIPQYDRGDDCDDRPTTNVPEPSGFALLAAGLIGFAAVRGLRQKNSKSC